MHLTVAEQADAGPGARAAGRRAFGQQRHEAQEERQALERGGGLEQRSHAQNLPAVTLEEDGAFRWSEQEWCPGLPNDLTRALIDHGQ